jgi:hypothetical protein
MAKETADILLHQNNMHFLSDFLQKNGIKIIPHSPSTPNLSPCDFSDMKENLRNRKFSLMETCIKADKAKLKVLTTMAWTVFQSMVNQWDKCTAFQGEYLEEGHT